MNFDFAGELYIAAVSGDVSAVQSLISQSTTSERQQCLDMALTIAAEKGSGEACEILIKNSADPNCRDSGSCTPLVLAIESSYIDDWQSSFICETLCQNGADVNRGTLDGSTPLMKAVKCGRRSTLQMLVYKLHANVNVQDEDGRTALMKAVGKGNADFCQIILTYGADTNLKDNDGSTALLEAAIWEDTKLVKTLIKAGADVNMQGAKGITPLMVATSLDWSETCRYLVEHGADLSTVNSFGETAEQLARRLGSVQALSVLQSRFQLSAKVSPRLHNAIPTRNVGLSYTLAVIGSVIYAFCCLGMLFNGGTYLFFELIGMLTGYFIWRGGNKEKSFWTVWLLSTFVSLFGLILGPIGALMSMVARLIIIRFIR